MDRLTAPQVKMLTKAMRDGASPSGPQWKTAGTLERQGLLVSGSENRMYVTKLGLEQLLEYRRRRWGLYGCQAYLLDMEEVEAALVAKAYSA